MSIFSYATDVLCRDTSVSYTHLDVYKRQLKKRITMMLKEKSNPWARLKYLYVLPLAAIAVTAFARPEISEKMEAVSYTHLHDRICPQQYYISCQAALRQQRKPGHRRW